MCGWLTDWVEFRISVEMKITKFVLTFANIANDDEDGDDDEYYYNVSIFTFIWVFTFSWYCHARRKRDKLMLKQIIYSSWYGCMMWIVLGRVCRIHSNRHSNKASWTLNASKLFEMKKRVKKWKTNRGMAEEKLSDELGIWNSNKVLFPFFLSLSLFSYFCISRDFCSYFCSTPTFPFKAFHYYPLDVLQTYTVLVCVTIWSRFAKS